MKVNKWEQMQLPRDTDDSRKRKQQGLDGKDHQQLKDGLKKRMSSRGHWDRSVIAARGGESDRLGGAECEVPQIK